MTEKQPYELVGLREDGSVASIEVLGRQTEPDAWSLAQEHADVWRRLVQLLLAPEVIVSSASWSRDNRRLIGMVEPNTSSRKKSGSVRNAIVDYLSDKDEASVSEILQAVIGKLGPVAPSSVRSSLNLNVGTEGLLFERTGRGRYRLAKKPYRAGFPVDV